MKDGIFKKFFILFCVIGIAQIINMIIKNPFVIVILGLFIAFCVLSIVIVYGIKIDRER